MFAAKMALKKRKNDDYRETLWLHKEIVGATQIHYATTCFPETKHSWLNTHEAGFGAPIA